jgi:phage-related protein
VVQSLGEAVIEVGADLDDLDGDLLRGTRRAARNAEREGQSIGDSLSRGIGRGASNNEAAVSTFGQLEFSLAKVAGAGTGLIGAIVPLPALLGGIVAGAVAVGGALGQAAGGALTAGTVLASFGLAAATVSVASKGLGEAFEAQSAAQEELAKTGAISAETQKELDAAMQNLAPSARNVVTAVQSLAPAWTSLQKAVQGQFFANVGADLERIGGAFLPVLRDNLVETAGVLNGTIRGFAAWATEGERVRQIDAILGGLNDTLAAILPAVGNIAEGLFNLFGGSIGPATEMATAISRASEGFVGWTEGIQQSGQLNAFLRGSNEILGTLVGIIGNVGSILISVFGAGAAQGATLLNIFEQATGQLAAFLQTAEAQSGLQQFFGLIQQSGEAIRQLGSVAVPIFQGIFSIIGALLPQIATLRTILLPIAQVLGQAIGGALTALAPVLGAVIGLILQLVAAIAPLVGTLIGALGGAIERIAGLFMENLFPAISGLIPILTPILDVFLTVFGAQVVNAINFIVDVLGGVFDILGGLITFLTGVFTGDWDKAWQGIQQIFDGVVKILTAAVEFLWNTVKNYFNNGGKQVLTAVKDWWTNVTTSFTQFQVRIIQGIASWIVGIITRFLTLRNQALSYVRGLWSVAGSLFRLGVRTVGNSVRSGLSSVLTYFRNLPGQIGSALGNLGRLLYDAGRNVVQGLIDGIAAMIGRLASAASNMAGTIRSYLPFSPAKEGPLSGLGNPEQSGRKIAEMVGAGITQNVNVPARAMQRALAPVAPGGRALEPLRRATQQTGTSVAPVDAGVSRTGGGDVSVVQQFFGPTTSGGRLQEINWNVRFATQSRRETIGGVAR